MIDTTVYIRIFEPTEQLIQEVALAFTTLLTGKFLNLASIPGLLALAIFLRNYRKSLNPNSLWENLKKKDDDNFLESARMFFGMFFISYICFIPVPAQLMRVEADGVGNVKEVPIKVGEMNPLNRFALDTSGYTIPLIIGGGITLIDSMLYSNYGVYQKLFGSFYSEFVRDPYALFKNFDRVLASDNYESLVDTSAEEIKTAVLQSYSAINKKYAVVGDTLFALQGYNNKKTYNFFKDAGISPDLLVWNSSDEYHGFCCDLKGMRIKFNIAGLYETQDFAEKVRVDILSFKDSKHDSEKIKSYVNEIIIPVKKSMEVLDTIQKDIEKNTEIKFSDRDNIKKLIESAREEIRSTIDALEIKISSDLANITHVNDFLTGMEDKKTGVVKNKNLIEKSLDFGKDMIVTPFNIAVGGFDKVASMFVGGFVYIIYLIFKILFILVFAMRYVYLGKIILTIPFALYKSLMELDARILLVPVREYLILRLWNFGLMVSTLISFALPWIIVKQTKEAGPLGMQQTWLTLQVAIYMVILFALTVLIIKKVIWMCTNKKALAEIGESGENYASGMNKILERAIGTGIIVGGLGGIQKVIKGGVSMAVGGPLGAAAGLTGAASKGSYAKKAVKAIKNFGKPAAVRKWREQMDRASNNRANNK